MLLKTKYVVREETSEQQTVFRMCDSVRRSFMFCVIAPLMKYPGCKDGFRHQICLFLYGMKVINVCKVWNVCDASWRKAWGGAKLLAMNSTIEYMHLDTQQYDIGSIYVKIN